MPACPCGFFGDTTRECRCTGAIIQRYLGRVSGPLLNAPLRGQCGQTCIGRHKSGWFSWSMAGAAAGKPVLQILSTERWPGIETAH